jgi:hypothetical protein
VKTLLTYRFLAVLLILGVAPPGGASHLGAAGAAVAHETDSTDREESAGNEAAARDSRRLARAQRAGPPLAAIGRWAYPEPFPYSPHSGIIGPTAYRSRPLLQPILRI